jgi:hypothetical protein
MPYQLQCSVLEKKNAFALLYISTWVGAEFYRRVFMAVNFLKSGILHVILIGELFLRMEVNL